MNNIIINALYLTNSESPNPAFIFEREQRQIIEVHLMVMGVLPGENYEFELDLSNISDDRPYSISYHQFVPKEEDTINLPIRGQSFPSTSVVLPIIFHPDSSYEDCQRLTVKIDDEERNILFFLKGGTNEQN